MIDPSSDCTDLNSFQCVRSRLKAYLSNQKLGEWLKDKAPSRYEPFYSSFDLRDAGFKLAPVDANLYPAGFNNICPEDLSKIGPVLKGLLSRHLGFIPKKMAILPEAHTRNLYYAEHLYELRQLFRGLGIESEIGWLALDDAEHADSVVSLMSASGRELKAYPFKREGDFLRFEPFVPEFILLNNDFSSGYPEILTNIKQPIEPSPRMGWHTRKKSAFFHYYNQFAGDLAQAAGLDPWRLQVATRVVGDVDFDESIGLDRIASVVDEMLEAMTQEYKRRDIVEKPFVFVKNNSGTYGMGILKVESGAELLSMNRRERNKMAVGKNKLAIHEVIVQEGIPTRFMTAGVVAEPVIYLLGHELIGGFLRKNPNRGRVDNLNSKGMVFEKLCMSDLKSGADRDLELELVYGAISEIAAAAVTREIADQAEGLLQTSRIQDNLNASA